MKSDPCAPSAAIRAVDEMLRNLGASESTRDWLTAALQLVEKSVGKFPVELLPVGKPPFSSTCDWHGPFGPRVGVDRTETPEPERRPRDLN